MSRSLNVARSTENAGERISRKIDTNPSVQVNEGPREVTAASRADAPVPVAIAGYAPERVDQMRVGFYGMGYARHG